MIWHVRRLSARTGEIHSIILGPCCTQNLTWKAPINFLLSTRFDIIKAYSFWSQHAAQCCPAQDCHMASQQPAHPYDLLEAKQEVANHVVATRLEKSPPKLMKLEGHTAAITSCSAGPGIIASASEDKVIVQASTSQIDTTNYFAIYAWPMPSRRCCHWADQTCCARISARSSGM